MAHKLWHAPNHLTSVKLIIRKTVIEKMYWISVFVSTYIAQYHRDQILLRFLVKPLPIGLLLVDAYNKDNPLLVLGLLFSAAGDVLLIPSNGVSAALGVVSFFMG